MAHKVADAVETGWNNTMGAGGLGITGEGGMLNSGWNAVTGQIEPEDLNYAQWGDQQYNQDWNTQGQTGTAQGYTGQGYNAANAAPAQGYTGQGYDAATGSFQSGQAFNTVLDQAMGASQDFMDPNSQWAKGQQSILAESTGQQMGQAQAQQSSQLAARGMGGGGLRSMLDTRSQAEAGAQQRQGATNIATQGAQLGLQAMGQAGSMAGQQDQNMLQQALANQQAQNQASQFGASAQNQASQFGAGAQNTANQFSAGQQNQFSLANQSAQNQASQFGASAQNQANQWSAGAQNQMGQFNAQQMQNAQQFNVGNQMNFQSWNASQGFAADQFNASQRNAQMQGNATNNAQGVSSAVKQFRMCIPEGTKIDTPDGSIPIEDLKAGDTVNGFGNKTVSIMQKHEYKENPELKRFLKIYFDDGDTVDLCDVHMIKDKRAQEYNVGDSINGKEIVNIKWYDGVKRSYDLLTEDKGYRISGIPVNSMIEEMNDIIHLVKEINNGEWI